MRKIIQYMMMALIAVVLASCANDISEESTPTVKSITLSLIILAFSPTPYDFHCHVHLSGMSCRW